MKKPTSSFHLVMPVPAVTREARTDEIEQAVATGLPVPARATRQAKRSEILEACR